MHIGRFFAPLTVAIFALIAASASAAPIEFSTPGLDRNSWTLAPEEFAARPMTAEEARASFARQFDDLSARVGEGPYAASLAFIETGKFEAALAAIGGRLANKADPALGHEMRGVALAYLGRFDGAMKEFETAASLDQSLPGPRLKLGDVRFAAGDRTRAIASYEAAVRAAPADARALARLGVALEGNGDAARAVPLLAKALAISKPASLRPEHNALARALLVSGEPTKAIAVYAPLRAAAAQDRLATQIVAGAQLASGAPSEAIKAIAAFGPAASGDALLQYLLGRANAALGDYARSVAAFRAAREKAPGSPFVARDLATVLAASGEIAEAEQIVRALIDGPAPAIDDYAALGELQTAAKRPDDAEATYAAMLAKFPRDTLSHQKVGGLKAARGDYKGAIAAFRAGLKAGGDPATLLRPLAVAELRAGDPAGAAASVNALTRAQPKSSGAFAFAGSIHEQSRNWPRAEAAYRTSIALDGMNAVALNNLASVLARRGAYAEALPLSMRAYAIEPANPVIAGAYGWTAFKTGDAALARSILEPLAAKRADDRRLSYRLGEVLQEAGEKEPALAAYRKALAPGGKALSAEDRALATAAIAALSGR